MFNDCISELQRSKDHFKKNVADSFGQSISEKCYSVMLKQFNMVKNCHELSVMEENGIKTLLATLRLML
jgi:hypothetical protein